MQRKWEKLISTLKCSEHFTHCRKRVSIQVVKFTNNLNVLVAYWIFFFKFIVQALHFLLLLCLVWIFNSSSKTSRIQLGTLLLCHLIREFSEQLLTQALTYLKWCSVNTHFSICFLSCTWGARVVSKHTECAICS